MADQDQDDKKQTSVSEYLQAPRKKRKNYVIMATGPKFDGELGTEIYNFVATRYKQLAISNPNSPKDLRRQFGRNITLLIIYDEFGSSRDDTLEMVRMLKVKRKKETIPVLFLTRQGDELVEMYREKLAAFHETDDFCLYDTLSTKQVLNRVAVGLDRQNARKGRRYKTNFDVKFYHLRRDEDFSGQFQDMSVHGALLKSKDLSTFKIGDQIKLSIPFQKYVSPAHGEFIRLSAKVRRVYISGDLAGISFEHLEESQRLVLNEFITSYVNEQFAEKSSRQHF